MIQRIFILCLLGAAFAAASLPARADRDAVQFGSDIHVKTDAAVHDAVCFFCSVHVEGKVTGDIVVFFGNVHLAGDAQHDVVNFFGKVTAEDNASIEDDLVSFFGAVRLGQNVTVGKDLVAMFGSVRAAETVSVGGDRVVQPAWLFFGPLIFIALIVLVIVREYRAYRRRLVLRGYNFPPKQ
ncbi:MAG: hypothetical protein ABSE99_05105 [Terracidiphilus sp.]